MRKTHSKNHTAVIVICIVAGVLVVGVVVFTLLYIFKWKKKNNIGNMTTVAAGCADADIYYQKNASNVNMNQNK